MLDAIEKLLVLQDRDRKISKLKEELAHIPMERQQHQSKMASSQAQLEALKTRGNQLESDRKKLELDADSKRQQIERYALQQYQTKKNEEYRALNHEIQMCKDAITKLEDQQLELMEQSEKAQAEMVKLSHTTAEAKRMVDAG